MRSSLTLSLVLALAACKHQEPPAPVPIPAPSPAAKPDVGVATSPGAPGSQNLSPLANLGGRLTQESAHRPAVKVTPEQLFAALEHQGVPLATHHQVLATAAAASYCALGVTKESIAIAVCEYPSPTAARAGRELLDTRYAKLVPDAVRAINGNTLVTVANGSSHHDVRDRVIETFKSL